MGHRDSHPLLYICYLISFYLNSWSVLALAVVPPISVCVRKFGRFLRELSHKTQAAAAASSSIAEVHSRHLNLTLSIAFGHFLLQIFNSMVWRKGQRIYAWLSSLLLDGKCKSDTMRLTS